MANPRGSTGGLVGFAVAEAGFGDGGIQRECDACVSDTLEEFVTSLGVDWLLGKAV